MTSNKLVYVDRIMEKYVDKLEAKTKSTSKMENGLNIGGISTGFTDLDKMVGGLKQGLYVIAGAVEMSADTLQRNIFEHISFTSEGTALHLDFKYDEQDFMNQILSSLGRINITNISRSQLNDNEWERLTACFGLLKDEGRMAFCDCNRMTTEQLEAEVERVSKDTKLSMISINSMHHLRLPYRTDSRYSEMAEVSRFLKELSKKFGIPVVVTASVNRRMTERFDKRPLLSDLRDTGTISDDADGIFFVYRDEVYHEDTEIKGVAEIIVAKSLLAPIGMFPLSYQSLYSRFDNYAGDLFFDR